MTWPEKIERLMAALDCLGVQVPTLLIVYAASYYGDGADLCPLLCLLCGRCMTRSVIEPSPVRHASLALDAYVQFTSPIRRYSDILAHFNLKVRQFGALHHCGST